MCGFSPGERNQFKCFFSFLGISIFQAISLLLSRIIALDTVRNNENLKSTKEAMKFLFEFLICTETSTLFTIPFSRREGLKMSSTLLGCRRGMEHLQYNSFRKNCHHLE